MDLFSIELKSFQIFLVVLLRVSGIFVFSPIFSAVNIPGRVKYFATVMLSLVVFAVVADTEFTMPIDTVGYAIVLIKEFIVGLIIGFSAMMVMNVMQFAGKVIDLGMGMHMSRVLDPFSQEQASVIGQLLYVFAIFVLLITNAHHYIITAVVKSFDVVPINGLVYDSDVVMVLAHLAMQIFIVGFQIAVPIAGITFLITFTLGIVAKAVPQMNVFFVGLPLKIVTGLFLLMSTFHLMYPTIENLILGMKDDLLLIIKAMT